MVCRHCGNPLPEGAGFCTYCGNKVEFAPPPTAAPGQGMNFDFSTNTAAPAAAPKFYEYKVLTQKDKWFSGKFDPAILEQALNAYAQQGWRVIACATADIPGFGVTRQEFVTVLERER